MLLGILFLFFNCVCTAAPVIKITSEDYKQATALQLNQTAGATETEENQLTTSSYVSRFTHFSFRKQHLSHAYNGGSQIALANIGWQPSYFPANCFLPAPGYYAFLFRYNLF
ncbi:hypothetical protein FC093_15095 [Ilyomonas limi]|uniref:Uncharacterized protein n=1 Tax=Ilyomonas limi TaxID=2575867 RepID=A0A4U3KXB5_9BACT|nr:hypothetical protein [Ilyomonas limi]TKK67208.1 hypothetical protein FC093_15095 [Ilyomonas limi]